MNDSTTSTKPSMSGEWTVEKLREVSLSQIMELFSRAFSAGVGNYLIDEVCRQFVGLHLNGLFVPTGWPRSKGVRA